MANRIVLGAFDGTYVLRVSRPGFNVLSTSLASDQLAFDSRWSEAMNEVISGQIASLPSGMISFGRTFSSPPLVILRKRPWFGESGRWDTAGHVEAGATDEYTSDRLVVTTTGFYITHLFSGALMVENHYWPIYYSVYENFYG